MGLAMGSRERKITWAGWFPCSHKAHGRQENSMNVTNRAHRLRDFISRRPQMPSTSPRKIKIAAAAAHEASRTFERNDQMLTSSSNSRGHVSAGKGYVFSNLGRPFKKNSC